MCNCPSCVSSTNALTRRATTATARRRIRFGNAFTVFSSSLAATAAFADSTRKDVRRREWERVISETRAEIEAKEIDHQSRLAVLTEITEREVFADSQYAMVEDQNQQFEGQPIRKVSDPYGPRPRASAPDLKRDSWGDVFEWAAQQDQVRAASGFQDWRGPPLSLLQKLSTDQLEELLLDDRLLRRFYGGQDCSTLVDETSSLTWSSKKLRTLEWSVAKLVYQLLLHCSENPLATGKERVALLLLSGEGVSGKPSSKAEESLENPEVKSLEDQVLHGAAHPAPTPDKEPAREMSSHGTNIYRTLAHIDTLLRSLHLDRKDDSLYEDFESPKLPTYRSGPSHDYGNVTALNKALYALLHWMERERDLSSLMTKICYNLLTSKNPPNINTYNLLLVRFCKLGNEDLVQAVLVSMRESHIRPNEVTHSTVLRFFTTTNNAFEFKVYLNRMKGYRGGLALAKPGQQISPIAMHTVRSFGQDGAKLAEKARMNGEVYVSLIVGALKFLSSQSAMFHYRNMISEGWKPNTEILTAILRHCCYRSDWNAGLLVWNQILEIGHRASTLSYQWVLRLCQVCGQQEMLDQILRAGVDRGALPVSMLLLPDEVKTQNIASILDYAEQIQRYNVRRLVPLRTRKWIRKLCSDQSNYALENAFQACCDEAAVRAMAERLKVQAKNARHYATTASQLLECRLNHLVKRIDYTVEGARRIAPMGNAYALKFRLTTLIRILDREKSELTSGDAHVASNYAKDIKMSLVKEDRDNGVVYRPDAKIVGDVKTLSANPTAPGKTAGPSDDKANHRTRVRHAAPSRQFLPMIPQSFSNQLSIQDPAPWEDMKKPLAATA